MQTGGLSAGERRGRALRAFLRLPGSRTFIASAIAFFSVLILAIVLLDVRYRDPAGDSIDFFTATYGALSLLTFGPILDVPPDALTRTVYVVVPITGLLFTGQVIGRLAGAAINRERWEIAMASTYSDHVIVCGLGRVGFRVVRWLLDLGEDVVVIDFPDDVDQLQAQVRKWGVPIIMADARQDDVLEQAGIHTCSAVMPVTDDDLVNLSVATAARGLRSDCRVVLRTFEDRLAENLQKGFDIYRAYSTSALAAPAFAAAAVHAPVDYAFAYSDTSDRGNQVLVTITKYTIVPESPLVGWTVQRIEAELGVRVLALRTDAFELNPSPTATITAGDGLVVSGAPFCLDRMARLAPPSRELGRYREGRLPLVGSVEEANVPAKAAAKARRPRRRAST